MNKTTQKEIIAKVRAKLEANGGRIVNTAELLGVTSVTLNSAIHGQRLYKKSWATLAKAVGVKIAAEDGASSKEPKTGVRAKKLKIKRGSVKAAPKAARKTRGAKKSAPAKRKAAKTPKAKALASIKRAVSKLRTGASKDTTPPPEAAPAPAAE